jgi:PAT family beta-lactamase induction signal transducer AmpG
MNFIRHYTQPLLLKICLFGFASGLSLMLSGNSLNFWLTKLGLSTITIGLFSLAALPYAFKFIWAPFVDLVEIPLLTRRYGRRLSWIIVSQLCLIISLLCLGVTDPATSIIQTAILGFIIAFTSVTQDISLDALRVNSLNDQNKGLVSSMYILGYRIGMLCSGGGAIYLSTFLSWGQVYMVLAGIVFINLVTIFYSCQNMEENITTEKNQALQTFSDIVAKCKSSFINIKQLTITLLFIILYNLSDNIILAMSNPFFLSVGFDEKEIVKAAKVFGLAANLFGNFISGYFLRNMSIYKALLVFGSIHLITHILFIVQSLIGHNLNFLYLTMGMENFTSGMAMAAFITFITGLCSGRFAGTQYSIYSSMMGISRVIIPSISGFLVVKFDWPYFFLINVIIATIPLMLIPMLKKK